MAKDFDKDFISKLKKTLFSASDFTDTDKIDISMGNFSESIKFLEEFFFSDFTSTNLIKKLKDDKNLSYLILLLTGIRQKDNVNFLNKNKESLSFSYKLKTDEDIKNFIFFISECKTYKFIRQSYKPGNLKVLLDGISIGMDTNARKNRTGSIMASLCNDLVKKNFDKLGLKYEYKEELSTNDVKSFCETEINWKRDSKAPKKFDFAVFCNNHLFLFEFNFYGSNGSKLNETSKSYIQLNEAIKKINSPNVHFIWVTDGIGWLKTKNGIKEAYNKIKHLYNIDNLENHVIYEDFKDILKKK